jgi:hypothetical protein
MNAGFYFVTITVIAVLSWVLGAGMMYDHDKATLVASAYGCGRHDAMQTAHSDPAEYDLPPCVELRKIWLKSEEWPRR